MSNKNANHLHAKWINGNFEAFTQMEIDEFCVFTHTLTAIIIARIIEANVFNDSLPRSCVPSTAFFLHSLRNGGMSK